MYLSTARETIKSEGVSKDEVPPSHHIYMTVRVIFVKVTQKPPGSEVWHTGGTQFLGETNAKE